MSRTRTAPDALIPLPAVCERLGVSAKTARRRIADAGIRPITPGRVIMLTEAEYARVLEATRDRAPPPPPVPASPGSPDAAAAKALRMMHRRQTRRIAAKAKGEGTAFGFDA